MCNDDSRDIQLACEGDGQAYSRIVGRYQDRVTAWMWRFTHDRQLLEELVQDVFVQAYFGLDRYREQNQFERWLFKIATHVGYRFWTRAAREGDAKTVALEAWDGPATEETDHAKRQQVRIVRQAMQSLGPRDRLVLTLRYLDGLSVEQAADMTGWSQTMVKVQTYRAKQRLGRLLKKSGIEQELK